MTTRLTRSRILVAAGIAGAIALLSFGGLALGLAEGFQRQMADTLYPSASTDPRIAVVGIDARALAAAGRWPWPRQTTARLTDAIAGAGATLIVYDVVFDPPTDQDPELARSFRQARNVLLASAAELAHTRNAKLLRATSVSDPTLQIRTAAAGTGHAVVTADPDGVVRAVPLLVETRDLRIVPALSLAAYMRSIGDSAPPTVRPGGVEVGSHVIPTERFGELNVNFSDDLLGGGRPVVSAADVLAGNAANRLAGKIVFVGVTDPTLGDNRLTPTEKGAGMPGVLLQANAFNTIATRAFLNPASPIETVVVCLLLALLVALSTMRLPVWAGPMCALGLGAAYLLVTFVRFDSGTIANIVYPLGAITTAYVATLVYQRVTRRLELRDPLIGEEVEAYTIERVLGRGGMSVVYLANDAKLHRQVALKVMSADIAQSDTLRKRFLRETKLTASLDHPNVLPVFDAGEWQGQLYIAMRYIDGRDLASLLRDEGPFGPARTYGMLRQVASALDAAHERGLVHRDVKPGNILVAKAGTDSFEQAYLADFGLMRNLRSESALTRTGEFMGTLDYVAPEQIRGEVVGARADVYSLGCVVFEMLAGGAPYAGRDEMAVLYAHLDEAPPRVTDARPLLPPALDDVVACALAKSPSNRYGTCGELAEAFRRAAETADDDSARARLELS